jgi:hypothetical protein
LNAESEILHERAGRRTSETVAGYLSAIAIFVSLAGIAWHPLRLILPSLLIALVAAGMAGPARRLPLAAVSIGAVSLFFGFAVAVATNHPLW